MSTRDCERCVFARPYGGENDNRCSAWDCEFIDRKEAIKAYREKMAGKGVAMRLIDADALKKDVEDFQSCYNGFSDTYDKAFIIGAIEEQPTVDAVEVVRCKDCKHKQQCRKAVEYITREPTSVTIGYKSIDYCSYGEKNDDNNTRP